MKAKLNNDWGAYTNGTILLMKDSGEEICRIVVLSVNSKLIDVTKYHDSVRKLAEELVETINGGT